jgi:hypothetical protein
MKDIIKITVWRDYGDNAPGGVIIHGVYGNVTVAMLKEMEQELNDSRFIDEIPTTDRGFVGITCRAYFVPSETQYGTGHGDVLTLHGYWDFTIIDYVLVDHNDHTTHFTTIEEI